MWSPGCAGLLDFVDRQQPHVAAIDQRVAQVARIEEHGAIHGGDAHAIAVIAHSGDDALHHALGMQGAGRDVCGRRVGRGEAKHIGIANRLRAQAGAERIANHAAQSGIGAAVRLEGRGMVVRLDLEHDMLIVEKADDAGIIAKHAHAPIVGAELAANLDGGGEDRFLEHILEVPLAMFVAIANAAGKRLVAAMLAPSLGDGLQLDVGRLAAEAAEMGLDRPHLVEAQIQLPLAR